jgi:hypothetical protein
MRIWRRMENGGIGVRDKMIERKKRRRGKKGKEGRQNDKTCDTCVNI